MRQGYRVENAAKTLRAEYPRSELVIGAFGDVKDRLVYVLHTTKSDWRTPQSLARQLHVDTLEVDELLHLLSKEGVVRRPLGASGDELDYYRLRSRRYTWQERLRRFRLALERTPVVGSDELD